MFNVLQACLALRGQVAQDRDHLHRSPERSGEEAQTLAWIGARLDRLGIPWRTVEHGGLVAELQGAGPGRRLLLRADIDALPVAESPRNLTGEKRAVSGVPGVSHACGHDAHTAMLLGALQVLWEGRGAWRGELVAVFEQGEETAYGALPLLEHLTETYDGFDGCFALHVYADAPAGTLSVEPGYVMSGALSYDIELRGRGGHSARPDHCVNPIDCFVAIYQDLASVRMRCTDPGQCLTYAVGVVEAGRQSNIIPERLRFAGMARFFDAEACGAPFLEALRRCVDGNAALYGCEAEYRRIFGPAPGVYNDAVCAKLAGDCLRAALGEDAVRPAPPWMASESLAIYHRLYAGVLGFLGIRGGGCGAPHHAPEFDLDGDRLYLGSAAFAAYALGFFDPDFTPPPRRDAAALLRQIKQTLS